MSGYEDFPESEPYDDCNDAYSSEVVKKFPANGELGPSSDPSNASKASNVSALGNELFELIRPYIGADTDTLMLLTLWCLHTWVYQRLYSTPRLLITSILPGAGKSTVLEWLKHLCANAVAMASISSAAMLARLADQKPTLLIDEADRSLRKDNPLTGDFLAIANSGYKRGGARPTLIQIGKSWETKTFSTWAPIAFAGNNPDLPDDTKSRCIPVFLYPDRNILDSDWELIEENETFQAVLAELPEWAKSVDVSNRSVLTGITGRLREKWLPLARVAQKLGDLPAAGERLNWLQTVQRLALVDKEQQQEDESMGLYNSSPHIAVLKDIAALWASQWQGQDFVSSQTICTALATSKPTEWGSKSTYGSDISSKRLAGMLKKSGVQVSRNKSQEQRGYYRNSFAQAWAVLDTHDVQKTKADTLDGSDTLDGLKESPNQSDQLSLEGEFDEQ